MSLENRVTEIIVNKLGVRAEEVSAEANFQTDLGADSLDLVELMMDFEDSFKLKISDEDSSSLKSVGDVIKYLKAHGVEE
ncbi:MAG TPA: acyl carrier protein [Candidatus Fermentibacter daniensis]|jgi:acyl carrier protein|nr:MAG: acyl carrier protein [Candidatus Fermentibacter daniensis]MBP7719063.1 acyl carrier protein [Candidatus Fermentibacter sp.]OQC70008.1 MAG: Acyl carrier protein [candidate division Hyd24-12 bacterium ADurb.Bin004]KZD17639.1 MAG: acyl carrier protein [Candidatus Fermentibacter daniensis]KZD19448.1 MAG: acyl carrier protein [Candidatus Fermentibacter daniensis]